jgi:hypothetical protein
MITEKRWSGKRRWTDRMPALEPGGPTDGQAAVGAVSDGRRVIELLAVVEFAAQVHQVDGVPAADPGIVEIQSQRARSSTVVNRLVGPLMAKMTTLC